MCAQRRRHIDQELEKIQEEMIDYTNRSKSAEDAEMEVLNELERTKKQIKELELQLSSWSSNIQQQSRDSDLSEVITKTSDAATVKNIGNAQDDMEIKIQELSSELVAAKASLHATRVTYKEAEENRSASIAAFEEENLIWKKGLNQVEEEVERLKPEYLYAKDLKSKLESASALLSTLKSELGNYIESKMKQETADAKSKIEAENSKIKLLSAKKELEQVKLRTDKAKTEVGILNLAASSLQSELDKEKEAVSALKKQIGMAMVTIQSLEEELSLIDSETTLTEMQKKQAREIIVTLPIKLQKASDETDQAKNLKVTIHEELRKARDAAEQTKAEACTMETRLHAAEKEIEATKASKNLALAAIRGLQESETAFHKDETGSENVVIISLEEYQMLSYLAQEAEDQSKTRLAAALIQIEAAKKSESKSLQKLEELSQELSRKKSRYITATKKTDKALNEKLNAEQEFRSWRTRNEQRRKATKSASITSESSNLKQKNTTKKTDKTLETDQLRHTQSLKSATGASSSVDSDSSQDLKIIKKKKKRSLFPTLLKFFGRGKSKSYESKKVM